MNDSASTLAPLRHGTFRAIWGANLVSSFGALIQAVGAAWLMTTISDSVAMVALVQASVALPLMLFSLVGGAIADNFNRRGVMLVAQLFMLCIGVLLTAFAYFELLTPWLLLTFTFLVGCGTALNNPSWQASVGDIVPRSDVPAAVAINSIGFNLSRSAGPAVGGAIVAAAGAAAAFAVNALTYLPIILVLWRWKPPSAPRTLPREAMVSAMLTGLRYVAMSPTIGRVLLRTFAFGLAASAVLALLPVVANALTFGGPLLYGLLLGAFGIGAVGGALLSARLHEALSSEAIVRGAFIGSAVCAGIVAVSTDPWPTGAALLLGGACWVLTLSRFNVTVQLTTPRWVVGRALSLYQTATFAGTATGSWLWGVAAEHYGVETALIGSGLLMLAAALLGLRMPLPPDLTLNLDPLNRWREPHLELDLQPRSGPIVVTIEFVIKPADVPAFLQAMSERRRVRLRDGARHWTLMRDLENPELWFESFKNPTWVEYVRHSQRTTHADAGISDRLRALHSGTEPPRVHRMIERPPSWFASIATAKGTIDPH